MENVDKSFPGVKALEGMRFDLRKGEVLGLVGENGAGKSTLMKLLTGIYTRETGSFWLNGEPLEVHNPREAQEAGLAIIHQELNLVSHLTVAENIWLGREPVSGGFFTRPGEQLRKTRELLERLGLALDPRTIVSRLSVAQQQMVEIAKALSFEATKVLIMDEPTAALNDAEVDQLHELIRRFITPETGVVYISHRMAELKRIADRITVIRDGHYIDTMPMAETSLDQVISKMVGRAINTGAKPHNVRTDRPIVLSVSGLSTKALLKDITFDLHRGEVLGFAGLMGAGRTEVARALVGADPITSGEILLNSNPVTIHSPGAGGCTRHRLPLRGPQAPGPDAAAVRGPQRGHQLDERQVLQGVLRQRQGDEGGRRGVPQAAQHQDPVGEPAGQVPVRRQPAEGDHRPLAGQGLRHPHLRRAHPRHRRGRERGDLPAAQPLAEQGKTIIMISSELPEILRMSHRVVVMADGRIKGVLSASEASQESIMRLATHSGEVITHTTEKAGR